MKYWPLSIVVVVAVVFVEKLRSSARFGEMVILSLWDKVPESCEAREINDVIFHNQQMNGIWDWYKEDFRDKVYTAVRKHTILTSLITIEYAF